MKTLPTKLKDPKQTKHRKIYETVNQLIDFIEYFIRSTEQCCSCGGCARHPNKKIEVVPSPRIDWCGDCQKEHGYDCPKDKQWCSCPFPTSLNDDDCDSCALPILTPPEDTSTKPKCDGHNWEVARVMPTPNYSTNQVYPMAENAYIICTFCGIVRITPVCNL